MFSTLGDVQYIRGVQYIGGCSVHWGDIMMNVRGYHEYIGVCSVHQRDTMSTSGDITSTSRDITSTSRDVQYIGWIS